MTFVYAIFINKFRKLLILFPTQTLFPLTCSLVVDIVSVSCGTTHVLRPGFYSYFGPLTLLYNCSILPLYVCIIYLDRSRAYEYEQNKGNRR